MKLALTFIKRQTKAFFKKLELMGSAAAYALNH